MYVFCNPDIPHAVKHQLNAETKGKLENMKGDAHTETPEFQPNETHSSTDPHSPALTCNVKLGGI